MQLYRDIKYGHVRKPLQDRIAQLELELGSVREGVAKMSTPDGLQYAVTESGAAGNDVNVKTVDNTGNPNKVTVDGDTVTVELKDPAGGQSAQATISEPVVGNWAPAENVTLTPNIAGASPQTFTAGTDFAITGTAEEAITNLVNAINSRETKSETTFSVDEEPVPGDGLSFDIGGNKYVVAFATGVTSDTSFTEIPAGSGIFTGTLKSGLSKTASATDLATLLGSIPGYTGSNPQGTHVKLEADAGLSYPAAEIGTPSFQLGRTATKAGISVVSEVTGVKYFTATGSGTTATVNAKQGFLARPAGTSGNGATITTSNTGATTTNFSGGKDPLTTGEIATLINEHEEASKKIQASTEKKMAGHTKWYGFSPGSGYDLNEDQKVIKVSGNMGNNVSKFSWVVGQVFTIGHTSTGWSSTATPTPGDNVLYIVTSLESRHQNFLNKNGLTIPPWPGSDTSHWANKTQYDWEATIHQLNDPSKGLARSYQNERTESLKLWAVDYFDAAALSAVTVDGFSTTAANGSYTLDGGEVGGEPTYSNGNGWYMFFDGDQWIVTDTAYDKTGNWIANGTTSIAGPFTINGSGFNGQAGTATLPNSFSGGSGTSTASTTLDDAPTVATTIPAVSVNEDASDTPIDLTTVFTDVDDDDSSITKTAISSNPGLVVPTIAGNDLTLSYPAGQSGSATVTVTGTSGTKTVTTSIAVTVTPHDTFPVFTTSANISIPENTPLNHVAEASGGNVTYRLITGTNIGQIDQLKFLINGEGPSGKASWGGFANPAYYEAVMTWNPVDTVRDFENPTDLWSGGFPASSPGDNKYACIIGAENSKGEATQTLVVTVTDITEVNSSNLTTARDLWFDDQAAAIAAYGHISYWDVSAVTDMGALFSGKADFNEDLSRWNVVNVTNMQGMFNGASAFNQPIGDWNTSSVTDMDSMFENATAFNQDISGWDVTAVTTQVDFDTSTYVNWASWEKPDFLTIPAIASNYDTSVVENTTAVATIVATGGGITYGKSGVDAAFFTIDASTGVLAFASAPDFETPADGDGNNAYEVAVTATNILGSTFVDITVTVTDAIEVPVITSNGGGATAAVMGMENNTSFGVMVAATGGNITYSKSGTDAALFYIDSTTGVLVFNSAPDYENPSDNDSNNVYELTVTATNSVGSDSQDLEVTILNVLEPPVITSNGAGPTAAINVAENTTAVTTVTARVNLDYNPPGITYSKSGTDHALFTIDSSTGVLAFASAPDFEAPGDDNNDNDYEITVTATNAEGADSQNITVTVTDVEEQPVITSNGAPTDASVSVPENTTAVATVVATGGGITYSKSGWDADDFAIDSSTGVLTFASAPDFEAPADANTNNLYNVTITATNTVGSDSQNFFVTVTDVVEETQPVITSNGGLATAAINAAENQTAVTTAQATGHTASADNMTWSITGGADQNSFSISDSGSGPTLGILVFQSAPDWESPSSSQASNDYVVEITATNSAGSDSQTITVTVTDVVEESQPLITSNGGGATAAISVAENTTATVATVVADGFNITYSKSGTDAGDFNINSSTGVLTFASAPDFENPADANTDNDYVVIITATNTIGNDSQTITVTVTDVSEQLQPDFGTWGESINVAENQTAVVDLSTKGNLATAGGITYAISGTDASFFDVDSSTGIITWKVAPDFENPLDSGNNNQYVISSISATNTIGNDSYILYITVTDVAELPDITSNGGLANVTINVAENTTAVTTVVATEGPNTFTKSGTDHALFTINSSTGVLTFTSAPDFETKLDQNANNDYEVTVTATNGAGAGSQNITVNVTDVASPELAITNNSSFNTALALWFSNETDATATYGHISDWDVSAVTDMSEAFRNRTSFNEDISDWDVSNVTNMYGMFYYAYTFNQPLGDWVTSSVTAMNHMFRDAMAFNQPIGNWNTSAVTTMYYMFEGANAFNQAIGDWNTSAVTNMSDMFKDTNNFNQDVGDWNVSAVTDMYHMFNGAVAFNQDLGMWDVAAVTTSTGFDLGATSWSDENKPCFGCTAIIDSNFQTAVDLWISNESSAIATYGHIRNWDVSAVTDMNGAFYQNPQGSSTFNEDIGNWDTSSVTIIHSMFRQASAFNQDISTKQVTVAGVTYTAWDMSKVENMSGMFYHAIVFNQDISNWDTGKVENMNTMFKHNPAFDQDISGWDVGGITSTSNYSYFDDGNTNSNWTAAEKPVFPTLPVITGGATAAINAAENQTAVTTVVSSGGYITFTKSGTDHALFTLDASTGVLAFASSPDFETPGDADTNNDYEVTVTATNSIGTDSQDITVNVTDVVDALPAGGADLKLFGRNANGQIGIGSYATPQTSLTAPTGPPTTVLQTHVIGDGTYLGQNYGHENSFFVKADGSVWGMGGNSSSQLGLGSSHVYSTKNVPTQIVAAASPKVVQVASSGWSTMAVKDDGTMLGWGNNAFGQLGTGDNLTDHTPTATPNITSVKQIVISGTTTIGWSLALKTNGQVFCTGSNPRSVFGDVNLSTSGTRNTWVQGAKIGSAYQYFDTLAVGEKHVLGLKSNGTLWTWGDNTYDQLGHGNTIGSFQATPKQLATDVAYIAAHHRQSYYIKTDGSLWAFGYNVSAQLGTGSATFSEDTPQQIESSGVYRVAAGEKHALYLKTDGSVWGMGTNSNGQLGDGTTTDRTTKTQCIASGSGIVDLYTGGGYHSAALLT